MRVILRKDASQAEVGDLRVEISVQKDIARFDVAMHDTRVASLVQVRQTARRSFENPHPRRPIHLQPWFICTRSIEAAIALRLGFTFSQTTSSLIPHPSPELTCLFRIRDGRELFCDDTHQTRLGGGSCFRGTRTRAVAPRL